VGPQTYSFIFFAENFTAMNKLVDTEWTVFSVLLGRGPLQEEGSQMISCRGEGEQNFQSYATACVLHWDDMQLSGDNWAWYVMQ